MLRETKGPTWLPPPRQLEGRHVIDQAATVLGRMAGRPMPRSILERYPPDEGPPG